MHVPSSFRSAIGAVAIILGGLAANGAQAATYCVASSAALQQALNQSADGGIHHNEDNVIEIVQGAYNTPSSGTFHYYSTGTHVLIVSGGYTAGCALQLHVTSQTVLDGHHATGVLSLSSANGSIAVDTLTLQNGESGSVGAGLQINYLASVNASVHVMNTIIRNNHSSVDAGGLYLSGAGDETWLINVLLADNSSDIQYGAGYVTGYGQFNEIMATTVSGNTAANQGGSGAAVGGLFCGGSRRCQVYNSIFWNNTTFGLYLDNSGAIVGDSDYGTLGGHAPATLFDNASVAPQFVNRDNGNYHLSSDSPLRNFSSFHVSDYDLDGHAYPATGNVDIGAYQH